MCWVGVYPHSHRLSGHAGLALFWRVQIRPTVLADSHSYCLDDFAISSALMPSLVVTVQIEPEQEVLAPIANGTSFHGTHRKLFCKLDIVFRLPDSGLICAEILVVGLTTACILALLLASIVVFN